MGLAVLVMLQMAVLCMLAYAYSYINREILPTVAANKPPGVKCFADYEPAFCT